MRWSIRIGSVRGVAVHVHALFALTLLWAAWLGWSQGATFGSVLFAVVSVCLLFGGVLLHEIAHTQQALAAGIPVRRIVLLPIGGLAELRSLPDNPKTEFKIAIAGPLANLGLATIFGGLTVLVGHGGLGTTFRDLLILAASPSLLGLLVYLTSANFALFAFNLMPIFPLDGGRILRSLLSMLLSPALAARSTAAIGRVLALGLGAVAMIGLPAYGRPVNISLALLALFLFFSSSVEAAAFDQRLRLRGLLVEDALHLQPAPIWTVTPADRLADVLHSGIFDNQLLVPVVVEKRLVGLLTRTEVQKALRRPGLNHVAHAMRTRFPRLTVADTLWEAQQLLGHSRLQALPVVEHGQLRGLITQSELRAAIRARRSAPQHGAGAKLSAWGSERRSS